MRACAARIERGLAKQAGVASANVNFATKVATVKFDPDVTGPERLAGVVEGLGYHAAVPDRKEKARRTTTRGMTTRP